NPTSSSIWLTSKTLRVAYEIIGIWALTTFTHALTANPTSSSIWLTSKTLRVAYEIIGIWALTTFTHGLDTSNNSIILKGFTIAALAVVLHFAIQKLLSREFAYRTPGAMRSGWRESELETLPTYAPDLIARIVCYIAGVIALHLAGDPNSRSLAMLLAIGGCYMIGQGVLEILSAPSKKSRSVGFKRLVNATFAMCLARIGYGCLLAGFSSLGGSNLLFGAVFAGVMLVAVRIMRSMLKF
ncbi:hypothetical protein ACIP5Z_11555, partial [Rothia terrae]